MIPSDALVEELRADAARQAAEHGGADLERLRQQLAEAMQTGPCDAGWPALIEFAADLNASDKALRRIAEAQGREFFDRGWQDTTAAEVLSFSPADAEYHELMHGEMTRSAEHWKAAAIKWVQQRDRAVAELNRQIAARDSAGEDARRLLVEQGALRAEVAHLRDAADWIVILVKRLGRVGDCVMRLDMAGQRRELLGLGVDVLTCLAQIDRRLAPRSGR